MKLYALLLFAASLFGNDLHALGDPLLAVVIMIKNEEPVIEATLLPYIKGGIHCFLVLDTGSTDKTVSVVRALFDKYSVKHGYIVEQPFINFATSRNYALECAEKQFPQAQFFLMPDAEWYVQGVDELLLFCKQNIMRPEKSFLVLLRTAEGESFYINRLFKAHKGIRFAGMVHEAINDTSPIKAPDSILFFYNPSRQGIAASRARSVRDLKVLQQWHQEDPESPRPVFYMAQTYFVLKDYKNAAIWYEKRCDMAGWEEECFYAHYRLGLVCKKLKDVDRMLYYFLRAYQIRPTRAEPLIYLAQYYFDLKEYALAYKFVTQAVAIPYPIEDVLFIRKDLYDFVRYELLGSIAWHTQQYGVGEKAIRQAIQAHPEKAYLHDKLKAYEMRKQAKQHFSKLKADKNFVLMLHDPVNFFKISIL